MHFDAPAATTLQIGGRKRWWYLSNDQVAFPEENSPRTQYLEVRGWKPPRKEEMDTVELGPGDFLHLPAGAWHCAEAQEDSLSLNLAFDHKDASISSALLKYASTKMDVEASNREPMFAFGTEPWLDEAVIAKAKSAINGICRLLNELGGDDARVAEFLEAEFGRHSH